MSSKDVKPKRRLGQVSSGKKRVMIWAIVLSTFAGGGYAAYRYGFSTEVEIPVARVRQGDFVIAVRTRGEIKSTRSTIISAPQVPDLMITKLAESGKPIQRGEVVVQFDAATQEQNLLERTTGVRTVDSEIVQTKASHKIVNEMDSMSLMQSEYNVERAKLEASKAEILSEIEGAKNRINVGVAQGDLNQTKLTINAHRITQGADLDRLSERRQKAERDLTRTKNYLSSMVLRAPTDGIVNVLPNYQAGGSWGRMPPPYKEGDTVRTGSALVEIPDLTEMRIELKLDEVDRGRLKVGQEVRVMVDAIRDREFQAELTWISPIAELEFRGFGLTEKRFPAHALLKTLDPRLRPGMSATADIIIESYPKVLLIPNRAAFSQNGKPMVYLQRGGRFLTRPIEVGRRNENDIVVTSGLAEGDLIALENPMEAARRAKKM